MTGLKICGLTRRQDIETCMALGVDAIGINLWPGSKRHVDLEHAVRLCEGGTGTVKRVGVFVDSSPADVQIAAERLCLDAIQLHGDARGQGLEPYLELGLPWIWVIRGTPELGSLSVPRHPPSWVLLDAEVAGYGGQGRQTDWGWASRAVRHLAPVPTWLAGGIGPTNAASAIEKVGPRGIDVASGAEPPRATAGEKSSDAIAALVRICHNERDD